MKPSDTTLARTGGAASDDSSASTHSARVGRHPASAVASPETGAPAPRTGGQVLVDALKVHGVDLAFGVPGESYLEVLDALHGAREKIRFVICRQEGGAAYMAEAYGKLTGRPGICMVTRGPGATNAAIGVHVAQQDSTPLILFVGQVGNDFVERDAFQEVDYRRMFGTMAKWVAQIDRADRVPEYVNRAFHTAVSGRPGPVVLALPEDMLTETTTVADSLHNSFIIVLPWFWPRRNRIVQPRSGKPYAPVGNAGAFVIDLRPACIQRIATGFPYETFRYHARPHRGRGL